MLLQQALEQLSERRDLPASLMHGAMREIMRGEASDAQIGALLLGLAVKGETTEELFGAASVMREFATSVDVNSKPLLDTCGTGGDARGLFNVSTAVAFVAACAGIAVAKHGNRSISGSSGSADVLEHAGVRVNLHPNQVAECIEELGIGFLFAPAHHGATRYVAAARRELRVRTMFNLLGPLTNPANASHQLLGVFARRWLEPVAQTLLQLGTTRALVVHSDDGLDEISICERTQLVELREGKLSEFSFEPATFGIEHESLEPLVVSSPEHSLERVREALSGRRGAAYDMVAINAAGAIYVGEIEPNLASAFDRAQQILDSGAALNLMEQLANWTRTCMTS